MKSSSSSSSPRQSPPPSTKRKRDSNPLQEINVDVNAPEPPSKKALRRAKKGKAPLSTQQASNHQLNIPDDAISASEALTGTATAPSTTTSPTTTKRSEHAIWIGNLPWTLSQADLSTFLTQHAQLSDPNAITRINLPGPSRETLATWRQQHTKPLNRGFAYVDFAAAADVVAVLALSEMLLGGRRVLVKEAGSFEGRPAPVSAAAEGEGGKVQGVGNSTLAGAAAEAAARGVNPPGKRIFVGNLTFDAQRDDLRWHFEKCGIVEDVFLTTFEDSGKCKGYGWVTFADVQGAENAVRGWVKVVADVEDEDEDEYDDGDEDADENSQIDEGGSGGDGLENSDSEMDSRQDSEKELRNKSKKTSEKTFDQTSKTPKTSKTLTTSTISKKTTKKPRMRKWWVNRFKGRALRMEFAEDKSTRYNKRYGKGRQAQQSEQEASLNDVDSASRPPAAASTSTLIPRTDRWHQQQKVQPDQEQTEQEQKERRPDKKARHSDARNIKPGSALANAQRSTAAIVASSGKKTKFE